MSDSPYDLAVLRFALSNLDSIVKIEYRNYESAVSHKYIIGRISDTLPNIIYISYSNAHTSISIPIHSIDKITLLDGTRQIIREDF